MRSSSRTGEVILRRALREQARRNRLGPDAACETCGDTALVHLNKVDGYVVCATCRLLAQGGDPFEAHHVAGHGEGPTVRVCGNCHAELSELQRDWPNDLPFDERYELGLREIRGLRMQRRGETNE